MRIGKIRGYLYILIGATLWGVSSVVAKSLFHTGLPLTELLVIRLTLATLALFLGLLALDRKRLIIAPRDLPHLVILGVVGLAGNQFTYYYTISRIHVGPGVLLQYLSLIWVTFYAVLFQREPLSRWTTVSLLLAWVGCYLVVGGYRMDLLKLNWVGTISGFISSFFFAFYTLWGEKGLKRYDPWTVLFYGFGFAAVLYWFIVSPAKVLHLDYPLRTWMAIFYIAVFSTLIPFGLYFKGMERIRATRASITSTWEPVVACLSAYLALGETLSPWQVIGGIAVLIAIVLLQMGREKTAPSTPYDIRQKDREEAASH